MYSWRPKLCFQLQRIKTKSEVSIWILSLQTSYNIKANIVSFSILTLVSSVDWLSQFHFSTFQMRCPMLLRLKCKDGETLEVISFNDEHNHEISQVTYMSFSQVTYMSYQVMMYLKNTTFGALHMVIISSIQSQNGILFSSLSSILCLKQLRGFVVLSCNYMGHLHLHLLGTELCLCRPLRSGKTIVLRWRKRVKEWTVKRIYNPINGKKKIEKK